MKKIFLYLLIILFSISIQNKTICLNSNNDNSVANNTIASENLIDYTLLVKNEIDSLINYLLKKFKQNSLQEYLDNTLSNNAGKGSESYVFAILQLDKIDNNISLNYNKYFTSLNEYCNNKKMNPVSSLNNALMYIALGKTDDPFVKKVANESIGKMGIMSYIYGMHILNNGAKSDTYTIEDVKEKLLTFYKEGYGFVVNEKEVDVDISAMAIQCLAPYYNEIKIKKIIDDTLLVLSNIQNENAGFVSYGSENPESASQVLLALSSLKKDAFNDAMFIKNNNNLLNFLYRYKTESGAYTHILNEYDNSLSTNQAFYSLVSYYIYKTSNKIYYIFK
ncbi:MAG: hypothetical protein Q4F88_03600 [Eubacteriales bacterium]|nr:hypothetical protein [Eubacteriales bacterium]